LSTPLSVVRPPKHRGLLILLLVAVAAVAIATGAWVLMTTSAGLSPPETLGPPLRVGDKVILLTGQWKETYTSTGSGRTSRRTSTIVDLYVDLWSFDATTATPQWRKRLQVQRDGAKTQRTILGADGDTVWLLLPHGLFAASLSDGAVIADHTAIEARNPPLHGMLSPERRFYRFDGQGLHVTATDARTWRIDPRTLVARPATSADATQAPKPDAVAPAYFTPNASHAYQARGAVLGDRWLGVLSDAEADALSKRPEVPGAKPGERRGAMAYFLETTQAPPGLPAFAAVRYRLWSSRIVQVSAAPPDWPKEMPDNWGTRPKYTEFAPLPAGPEFLQGGLFGPYVHNGAKPVFLRDPDSVLVLHRDRLGEQGRLRLARVAGPQGRVVWEAAMPLSVLQSVMPGGNTLVLYGRLFTPPPADGRPRDPMHTALEQLVSIDLATGAMQVHEQSVAATGMPAVPAAVRP